MFTEATPVQAFAALDLPIFYILGSASPEPAHAIARRLLPVLPRVKLVELTGLGHMALISHPERIKAEIAKFLREL